MRYHVDGNGKAVEDFPVAIAKDHLLAVPEGVLILTAIVHGAGEDQPFVIERIALILLPEEIMGNTQIIVRFIHRHVSVGGLAFIAYLGTRQLLGLFRIVDVTLKLTGFIHMRRGGFARHMGHQRLDVG